MLADELELRHEVFVEHEAGCSATVTDIAVGELHPQPGDEILLVDCEKARTIDRSGQELDYWILSEQMSYPTILGVDRGAKQWSVFDDGNWQNSKAIHRERGLLWRRLGTEGFYRTAAGNLDADPAEEYIVWHSSKTGFEILDDDGTVIARPDTTQTVLGGTIVPSRAGQPVRFQYVVENGELVQTDAAGEFLSRSTPDAPTLNAFLRIDWPENYGDTVYLHRFGSALNLLNDSGQRATTLTSRALANHDSWGPLRAHVVPLGTAEYLVVTVPLYDYPRTLLHVYDRAGTLVYSELLGNWYGSVAGLDAPADGTSSFLLGGNRHVLRYHLAPPERRPGREPN